MDFKYNNVFRYKSKSLLTTLVMDDIYQERNYIL